jgi:hypothetical protein
MCPWCHTPGQLVIRGRMVIDTGPGSLAGTRMQLAAAAVCYLLCQVCGWRVDGHLVDPHLDEDTGRFTAGYFVPDTTPTPPLTAQPRRALR